MVVIGDGIGFVRSDMRGVTRCVAPLSMIVTSGGSPGCAAVTLATETSSTSSSSISAGGISTSSSSKVDVGADGAVVARIIIIVPFCAKR